MGLFDFIKNQFIEVIEWTEQDRDVLVYRFPVHGKEIKNGAQLTVREGQAAVFVNEGKMADVFQPGRHRLSTANTPVLTKLGAWKHGFNSPFKAEVYFVTTRQFTDQKWGTPNPVIVRDPEFGAVRLRAFGNYAFRVEDPGTFLKEAVGTDGLFTTEEITGQLKSALVGGFGDLAAESRIPLLDLASHYDELASALAERTQEEFKKFGLVLRRCVIENISVPPEVEQALDRAAGSMAPRDLDRYTRVSAADALRASAEGEGGGIGAQIAAGMAVGSAMVGAVTPIGAGARPAAPAGVGARHVCGLRGHARGGGQVLRRVRAGRGLTCVTDEPPGDALARESASADSPVQFPCPTCGGETAFDAKQQALVCAHCGHAEAIAGPDHDVLEYDLQAALREAPRGRRRAEVREVACATCGARSEVAPDRTALRCGYCDQPVVLVEEDAERIVPETLLPFAIPEDRARQRLRAWLQSRWFRPNDLAREATLHRLRGRYVPAWTYDAQTDSSWTAMSGYHYWVTESYTNAQGKRSTRRVRKTRWVPSSGTYDHFFNDWLVYATRALPAHLLDDLGRWPLAGLVPYDPKYLAGHEAERYQVDLAGGWEQARAGIAAEIRAGCARRVPGDTHMALRVRTTYRDMTWKHLLLPLWVVAYRYRGKTWRIVVNGQTGQVDGEAPLSWAKILGLVLAILLVIGVVVAVVVALR